MSILRIQFKSLQVKKQHADSLLEMLEVRQNEMLCKNHNASEWYHEADGISQSSPYSIIVPCDINGTKNQLLINSILVKRLKRHL